MMPGSQNDDLSQELLPLGMLNQHSRNTPSPVYPPSPELILQRLQNRPSKSAKQPSPECISRDTPPRPNKRGLSTISQSSTPCPSQAQPKRPAISLFPPAGTFFSDPSSSSSQSEDLYLFPEASSSQDNYHEPASSQEQEIATPPSYQVPASKLTPPQYQLQNIDIAYDETSFSSPQQAINASSLTDKETQRLDAYVEALLEDIHIARAQGQKEDINAKLKHINTTCISHLAIFGPSITIARILRDLGIEYLRDNQLLSAEKVLLLSQDLFVDLCDESSFDLAHTYYHLGDTYFYMGGLESAEHAYQQALAIFTHIGDPYTPRTLAMLTRIQQFKETHTTLVQLSQPLSLQPLSPTVVHIDPVSEPSHLPELCDVLQADNHESVLVPNVNNELLTRIHMLIDEKCNPLIPPEDAIAQLKNVLMQYKAWKIREPHHDSQHKEIVTYFIINFARVYLNINNIAAAENCLKLINNAPEILHNNKALLAEAMMYQGELLRQQNSILLATQKLEEAFIISKELQPPLHAQIRLFLARAYFDAMNLVEVHKHTMNALTIFRQNHYSEAHPWVREARKLLASTIVGDKLNAARPSTSSFGSSSASSLLPRPAAHVDKAVIASVAKQPSTILKK